MCAAGTDGTGANPLKLQCASQRDQVWREGIDSHGDYNPTCTNSTANITKDPSMPDNYTAPANCSGTFADFLNKTSYPNSHELVKDKLWLQWRRAADGNSIEARMAYDGRFLRPHFLIFIQQSLHSLVFFFFFHQACL